MKRSFVIGGIVAAARGRRGRRRGGCRARGSDAPAPTVLRPHGAGGPATGVGTAALKPGTALVDGAGRTVYLFEADNGTTSTCTGSARRSGRRCPRVARARVGRRPRWWVRRTRTDGSSQVT